MEMVRATGNPDVIFLHCLPAFHDTNTKISEGLHGNTASPKWK
jgi:ornithine carbamoyltransferase